MQAHPYIHHSKVTKRKRTPCRAPGSVFSTTLAALSLLLCLINHSGAAWFLRVALGTGC